MGRPKKQIPQHLPGNLARFRQELGLSQADVAVASGIPIDDLRRYEQGTVVPSLERLRTLAEFFSRSMEDFLNPDPPKAKKENLNHFFLRTMPGVEIDQTKFEELKKIIQEANEEVRTRRTRTGKGRG